MCASSKKASVEPSQLNVNYELTKIEIKVN
jgi:hypothetical protein